MKKLAIAAAVAVMVAGCAHKLPEQPQVNRAAKADKYVSPAKRQGVSTPAAKSAGPSFEQPTPNEQVKKRWYDRFKMHPKWFHG